jgi:hypothetical protein
MNGIKRERIVNEALESMGFKNETLDDSYKLELLGELSRRFTTSTELKEHLDKLDGCCGKKE